MHSNRIRANCILATLTLSALAIPAIACNIPVFRYALERWSSDEIKVTVFHDSSLLAKQLSSIDSLRSAATSGGGNANILVETVSTESIPRTLQSLWEQVRKEASSDLNSPIAVAHGKHRKGPFIAWVGSLVDASSTLVDSPVRQKLAKRLLAGDAIVWLVIEAKNSDESSARIAQLQDQVKKLASQIELPEGIGLPGSELFSEVPLLLQHSILKIQRDDPNEKFLLGIFQGFQPEAYERGEALYVPVFGRGRALEVIPESQLDDALARDLTQFLCAACSCQVKEQNPGFDLLLNVDWDLELFGEGGEKPPASEKGLGQQKKVLLQIPPGRNK